MSQQLHMTTAVAGTTPTAAPIIEEAELLQCQL
jgi:hypothetical protein